MQLRPLVLEGVRTPGSTSAVDIVCVGSRIEQIGSAHIGTDGDVVRCGGGLVMPAFIDVHSHADGRLWAPELSSAKMEQGICYEVVGNCGLGPAPSSSDGGWRSIVSGVCVGVPEVWSFPRFGVYLEELLRVNENIWPRVGSLVPYGSARASVAGLARGLDGQQVGRVRQAISEALDGGALGVSLGLVYPPNDASKPQELVETLRPLARARRPLCVHVRSQANRWIEAIEEALWLCTELGVRLLISHLCVGGRRNQWKVEWVLARLREARRCGLDVWFDQHPYSAGSTSLTQLLPARCLGPGERGLRVVVGESELNEMLSTPSAEGGWENYLELVGRQSVLISGAPGAPEIEGKTVAELQAEWGSSIGATVIRLLAATGGNAAIVLTELYDERSIERIAAEPFGCFSTDSVHSSVPHPRLYGTYPYAFHKLCRNGLLSESEFVERSSRRPAAILGLENSGSIQVGEEADLIVIDADRFNHTVDFRSPWREVTGVRALVLAGELVVPRPGDANDNAHAGALSPQ